MYVVERWLARLSMSPYVDDFVLKGGMLLAAFGTRRPTADADTLARNIMADQGFVAARVAEIAALADPDDGVEFLTGTLTTSTIRENAVFLGVRAVMTARISTAHVKFRLDISFGDPVTPAPQMIELPALRPDTAPVRVLGYPIETVLAEKIATAIELGAASTRVRDWADIYTLTGKQTVTFTAAHEALRATCAFRGTAFVRLSLAIGALVQLRSSTYDAYRRGLDPDGDRLPKRFEEVVEAVVAFADPLIDDASASDRWDPESRLWKALTA